MVKARSTMCLDGDFSRDFPKPETLTLKQGDQWTVTKRGPSYINHYEVTEFDADGLAWLVAHRCPEAADDR